MGVGVVIKRQYSELASAEASAMIFGWKWWEKIHKDDSGVLFFPNARRLPQSLGLSRFSFRVIKSGNLSEIEQIIKNISWKKFLRGKSYRVTLTNRSSKKISEKEIAKLIGKAIQNSSITKMKDYEKNIDVVCTEQQVLIGLRSWTDEEFFEKRRAHLLPAPHPTSAHPTVARALIHLACAKRVHDPLCGSGGFLIEGGLAGKNMSGSDVSPEMIVRARKNTEHFQLRPEIRIADATQWIPRVSALVTDLPYGKSTKTIDTQTFVEQFLKRASQSTRRVILGSNQILCIPKKWHVRATFSLYVHKSMNRHFYVLERA